MTEQATTSKTRQKDTDKKKTYQRQTARGGGIHKDGKPFFWIWGRSLTRKQKQEYQRTLIITSAVLIALLAVGVLAFGWIDQTILIPGQPIVTVNGYGIPQSMYRKLLAYQYQENNNQIYALNQQQTQLQSQENDHDPSVANSAKQQLTNVQNQLATLNGQQSGPQIGSAAVDMLVEDELIKDGALQFEHNGIAGDQFASEWANSNSKTAISNATFTPTSSEIQSKLDGFKKSLPLGTSYNKFLSDNQVSDSDMRDVMALLVRRDKMQTFLSGLIQPDQEQVRARRIDVGTLDDAKNILSQLNKGGNFADLAKKNSVDVNTKDNGGEMGWFAVGQSDAAIELWAFKAKVNDLSPALSVNGSFTIVQLEQIQSRQPLSSNALSSIKANALKHWLDEQRAILGKKIGQPNQDMLLDPNNLPPALNQQNSATSVPGQPEVPISTPVPPSK